MKRNSISRIILSFLLVLFVSTSLLFLTSSRFIDFSSVSSSIRSTLAVVHGVFSKPVIFLSEKKHFITDLFETYDENQRLKQMITQMENTAAENESLKSENTALRDSLDMKSQYSTYLFFTATVSNRSSDIWNQELSINIGSADGISKDMLVLSNGGLIGTVEVSNPTSATVHLLSNSNFTTKIPVKITSGDTPIYGILKSYDISKEAFVIGQLNSEIEIQKGTKVVTSDLAGGIPSNISIGEVVEVKTSLSDLNREVFVKPTADFSSIYAVTVVGQ